MKVLTVKKTVTKGDVGFEFFLDSEKIEAGYKLSQQLTGTTDEENVGVFAKLKATERFSYGKRQKIFTIKPLTDDLSPNDCLAEILDRIKKVREWVAEMKILDIAESGEASGYIEPTVAELLAEVETLKAEKADITSKVARDDNGRFAKKADRKM